jgi:hypothetical protein
LPKKRIKETPLKRTRRIEVIRYSRRFTEFTNDGAPETDPTAEQAAIDILLQMPEAIPIAPGEIVGAGHQGADSNAICTIRNGRFFKLFGWLVARKSWRGATTKEKGNTR